MNLHTFPFSSHSFPSWEDNIYTLGFGLNVPEYGYSMR